MRHVHDRHVYDDESDEWFGPFDSANDAITFASQAGDPAMALEVENYTSPRYSTFMVPIAVPENLTGPKVLQPNLLCSADEGRLYVHVSSTADDTVMYLMVGSRAELNSGNGLIVRNDIKIETRQELFGAIFVAGDTGTGSDTVVYVSVMQGFNS